MFCNFKKKKIRIKKNTCMGSDVSKIAYLRSEESILKFDIVENGQLKADAEFNFVNVTNINYIK